MLFGPSGDLYDGDLDPFDEIEAAEEAALMPEADEWTPETFDKYLAAEVLLPHGGELERAKVMGRKRAATPVFSSRISRSARFCHGEYGSVRLLWIRYLSMVCFSPPDLLPGPIGHDGLRNRLKGS
jgi:hypothetical protein